MIKKATILLGLVLIVSCFFISKSRQTNKPYLIAYVQEVIIDKADDDKEKSINNYLGIFPKNNDTTRVFRFVDKHYNEAEQYVYWSEKHIEQNTITFLNAENDKLVLIFQGHSIYVGNDVYEVNESYFKYLRQKILIEGSILDLAFFLKDGFGDYALFLEPLSKNWRHQTENNPHRIIKPNIKKKNLKTDDQFFE